MFDDLYPEELDQELRGREQAAPRIDPGFAESHPKLTGAAKATMRELARAGSSFDLLGAAVPVTLDWMKGGSDLQDQYFREHDEVFSKAVDYWTPSPQERSLAGDVAGGLVGMGAQFMLGAPVLLNTAFTGTAEELVKQGVDAGPALTVGGIQGLFTAAGIRLPAAFGTRLVTQLGTGAAGNVALGTTARYLSQQTLEATGHQEAAQSFEPLALDAVLVEAGMGALFGGMAHMSGKPRLGNVKESAPGRAADTVRWWMEGMKPSDKDAVLTLGNAVALEKRSLGIPARPKDLDTHVQAMEQAIRQAAAGDTVDVAGKVIARDMQIKPDPERPAQVEEAHKSILDMVGAVVGAGEDAPQAVRAPEQIAKRMAEPGTRDALANMAREAGWEQEGGHIIRMTEDPAHPDYAIVTGRTQWIPRADWWPERPAKLNEAQVKEAVRKALAGEKLSAKETRAVDYMLDVVDRERRILPDLAGPDEVNRMADMARQSDMDAPVTRDTLAPVREVDIIQDALKRLGEDIVERVSIAHEGDRGGFVSELTDRLNAQSQVKAALQALKDNPHIRVADGLDADGNPILKSADEAMRDANAAISQAKRDAKLFEVAANCMTRG